MNPETEREPLRRVEIHDFRLNRQAPTLQRRRQFEPVRDRKNRVQRMPRIDRQRRLDRYGFIRQDRRLERKRRGRDQAVQRAPVIRIRKPVRLAVEFDLKPSIRFGNGYIIGIPKNFIPATSLNP